MLSFHPDPGITSESISSTLSGWAWLLPRTPPITYPRHNILRGSERDGSRPVDKIERDRLETTWHHADGWVQLNWIKRNVVCRFLVFCMVPDALWARANALFSSLKRAIADNLLAYYVLFTIVLAILMWALIVLYGDGTFGFWEWTAQSWQAVGTFAALTGVIGIFIQVRQNAERQRKETGPYVRVDIGPTVQNTATPFTKPEAYIVLARDHIDVAGGVSATPHVSISAWLRNYQSHPLGMCFTVQIEFHYSALTPLGNPVIGLGTWDIAYLEHDKPVQIELFRLPKDWSILVELFSLKYQDFYGVQQSFSGDYSTGIHGRLMCSYDPQYGFESLPIALPKTPR